MGQPQGAPTSLPFLVHDGESEDSCSRGPIQRSLPGHVVPAQALPGSQPLPLPPALAAPVVLRCTSLPPVPCAPSPSLPTPSFPGEEVEPLLCGVNGLF